MRLTLSVLTLQDQAPFTSMTYTFDQSGGSVGRHQRANWVLLDDKKFLSGEHFSINCDGKDFFVVDASTNGTFINDSIHPLGQNNSHRIAEKDRIRIGEYVLIASIFSDSITPQSSFPMDNSYGGNPSGGDPHDPFFSPGGNFNDSSNSASPQNDSMKTHDPYENSSKSSFVDPNMAGTFGQPSSVESSSDPFFSSGDAFSPHETPFNKEQEEDIIAADTPLNMHTPLPSSSINARPKNPPQPSQVPAEVFTDIKETEEPDAFDFLDSELPDTNTEKEAASIKETPPVPEPANPPVKQHSETISDDTSEIAITPKKKTAENKPPKKIVKAETPAPDPENKADINSKSTPAVSADSEALKMLLKGAGITQKHLPSEVPAETFEIIGHALKEVLQGTIELLRARAETKNHLHLDRTIIGNIENNPLKFMPNAEQVIVHLLTSENSDRTYTPLDKALEEAFDDIMAHQFAMTVATQSALKGVIKQHFSPKNLADNMAKDHPISSLIPLQRQAKLWSMFESLYEDVEKEATENFQRLLDNEISNAYEKQLMELKSLRMNNNNGNSNDFPE